jgi:hypothetical protein
VQLIAAVDFQVNPAWELTALSLFASYVDNLASTP